MTKGSSPRTTTLPSSEWDPDPDDDWDEDVCDEPECSNRLDDGEGYDGYCGTHADIYEQEGRWG